MAKKPKVQDEEPKEEAPVAVAKTPLTGVERFRAEFQISGDVKPLKWEPLKEGHLRLFSPQGVLCYEDGTQVHLPAGEASQLASELRAIRPRDNIQLIP